MKKRILSIVLAICLVLTLVPTMVFAEDSQYVVAGTPELCGSDWDLTDPANLMTEVSPNVYEITYTDVAYGPYQFKFTDGTGTWDNSWSGVYEGSGIESDAVYDYSDSITFEVPYELADVIIRFDLTNYDFDAKTGAKFTVTVVNKTETTAPSVSVYATKAQLMDDTFAPDADGCDNNIGKLAFGINDDGYLQEWYILGADSGVDGDNTIIFAASPIATGQQFSSITNDKTYNYEAGTGYGDFAGSTTVFANHYGASDLRVALQNMATDTNYFTSAEQGLMNATTVTTYDKYDTNNIKTYTNTDKLYALAADGYGFSYNTIKAGSGDSTVLAMNSYWSSGNDFWLRSPFDGFDDSALVADPGAFVYDDDVLDGRAVQPASNLNLTNVLFSSAVTEKPSNDGPVAGNIASDKAMTLRFDGSSMDIGTVEYDPKTDTIKAQKGSADKVALVVQGKNVIQKQDESDEKDWFFSVLIGEEFSIGAEPIKTACSLSSLNLENCKIWLETVGDDGMIYAVNGINTIPTVEITDIDTPEANTALDTSSVCATTGVSNTTPSVTWNPNDSKAGYNTIYTASVTLTANEGYEFTDSTTATVNGNTATSVTKNSDGTLTVTYTFPATGMDKLLSITAPSPKTVPNGTSYDDMNLPNTVEIETVGKTATSATVVWNTTTPASGSYDPDILTQQTVTLNGTVTCPDGIDDNGVSLTTTITITISAADTVAAPQANLANGAYTSNQSVELSSATEGAKIYYTLDGSTPSRTNGTEYTGPISITGTEAQTVQTTIKAIAVKDKMQDSSVEAFMYTIQIPDTTLPTGEIKVDTNKWQAFFNGITFDLFFKEYQTVTITASDNSGDAVTIEYLLSDKELTVAQLDAATFTAYTDVFSINPDNEYVIYARLTDTSGNVKYINSNGIVLDATAPVISGVENGKTYCEAQTVTVTDKYLDSVTLDGIEVPLDASNQFILSAADAEQTIVATDKAGNQAQIIVTVKNGHTDEDKDNICDDCGSKLHEHTGGKATCISKAICEICGESYGDLDPDNHTGGTEIRGAKAATCTEEGYTGDTYCKGCGQKLSSGIVIPKLPHTDEDKDNICDICGATISIVSESGTESATSTGDSKAVDDTPQTEDDTTEPLQTENSSTKSPQAENDTAEPLQTENSSTKSPQAEN
ncbi:MAG: chitobiase/beta-hexosaminidase C-terminal domain-containing protein, partial [Eubacterium sp.]